MKNLSEQFAQFVLTNRERGTFPSQPKVNLRGGPSSSFPLNPNDVRNLNFVIGLRSERKIDMLVGDNDVNVSPPPFSTPPFSQ